MAGGLAAGGPVGSAAREPGRRSWRDRWSEQKGGFLGGVALAGVDQALLSALSLAAAGLFIRFSSKENYGVYTLIAGLVLLGTGVQAALVTTPLTALGARMAAAERARFVAAAFRLQCLLALACSVLLSLVVALRGGSAWLALGAGVALAGGWMREFLRTVAFLDEQPARALTGDTVYVLLAAGGLGGAVWLTGTLSAPAALALVGAAALVPGPGLLGFLRRGGGRLARGELRSTAKVLLRHGRWTLPGMTVTWGGNSGYAYVVALALGPEPVAELAAARLFVMPLNLIVAAWNRAFLPRAGACVGRGDVAGLHLLCRRSVWLLGGGSLAWIALVALLFTCGGETAASARVERGRGAPTIQAREAADTRPAATPAATAERAAR